MNFLNSNSPELRSIKIKDLSDFLKIRNWSIKVTKKSRIFISPKDEDGNEIDLWIPSNEKFIDYNSRLADLINTVSMLYKKDSLDLLKEISSYHTDIFKARIIETHDNENSLPLDEVYKEISGLRSLFLYGASSEEKPSKHFDNPLKKAIQYLSTCKFGHTFQGSFGFKVELPLLKKNEIPDLYDIPFERKVNERIARGLKLIQQSVDSDNADILVDGYERAFNSRMCDAILNLSNQSKKDIELSFEWSDQVKISDDLLDFRAITLKEKHFKIVSYASDKLKHIPSKETVLEGTVINLHSIKNPEDDSSMKNIIIKCSIDEIGSIDVNVSLNSKNYIEACIAHINGKDIKIKGNLERTGTKWKLTNALLKN